MDLLIFIIWAFAGICNLISPNISKLNYALTWVMLMLELLIKLLDEKR